MRRLSGIHLAQARRSATPALVVFFVAVLGGCPGDSGPDDGLSDAGEAMVDTGGLNNPDGSTNGRSDGGGSDGGDSTGTDGGSSDGGGGTDGGPGADAGPDPRRPGNRMRDTDCDGLSDQEEFATIYANGQRTAPDVADSDMDGLPDGLEVGRTSAVPGTSCSPAPRFDLDSVTTTLPVVADTDGDGLSDGLEDANRNGRVDSGETDPNSADTDGDGLPDGLEDANRNGTVDPGETNPALADTDGDGVRDGVEDLNRDGVRDPTEMDPTNPDTDTDRLSDGTEDANFSGSRERSETDPLSPDTDCDGLDDFAELNATPPTSPLVADTDADGIPDGIEAGLGSPTVPGSCSTTPAADADPSTTTQAGNADSDNDGILDGEEDANQNGRVDPGETDPNASDTDGDGVSDGDEVRAGFNPLDRNDPASGTVTGINDICSDRGLKVVDFDVASGRWTLASEQSTSYAAVTVSAAGSGVSVAALDDSTNALAGFVVEMPLLSGAGNIDAQVRALESRIQAGVGAEGLTYTARASPRSITSHDGFRTAVSGLVDLGTTSGQNAAVVRNAMLRLVTNLQASAFTGLPTGTGSNGRSYVFGFQVLLRTQPQRLIVLGTLLDTASYDGSSDRSFVVGDLINGTALAQADARRDKDCDPFTTSRNAVADFLWMADISGSTDDDRGRIVTAATAIFNALRQNNVDFRMGVVPHTENRFKPNIPGPGGLLRGSGFTNVLANFQRDLRDVSVPNGEDNDGCEYGLTAIQDAIDRATPATTTLNARRFRANATVAVVYISDEFAEEVEDNAFQCFGQSVPCATGLSDLYPSENNAVCRASGNQACIDRIVQPFIQQLQGLNAVAFAQVIPPQATPTSCNVAPYACGSGANLEINEPGRGYVEVVNATGGVFYSPCSNTPGNALQPIIDGVTGAASEFRLSGAPISATIRVGVVRNGMTVIVPRDKRDGFDYDAASNTIFFRGSTYRPSLGEVVVVSYRLWEEPPPSCPPGEVRDPTLGICVCDLAICNQNCTANEICDSSCNCACTPDCNGNCAANQVCNQTSCQCECASDCGGCPTGTQCNQATCQCECSDCGGACQNTNTTCNTASCACECAQDCGGACTGNTVCNDSLCDCVCAPTCEADNCTGFEVCDPAQNCACVCPTDCGGNCGAGTTCNSTSCQCECPANCDAQCPENQVCNPANGCACECPFDCGGTCAANERCEQSTCQCVPAF